MRCSKGIKLAYSTKHEKGNEIMLKQAVRARHCNHTNMAGRGTDIILGNPDFEARREMKKETRSIPLSRLHSQQVLKSLTTKN